MLPSPETTTLDIEGMSCAGCAPAVDKPLARTPGVQSALVNYATENATVRYLPGQATPAILKAAVGNAAYGVPEQAPDTSAADRQAEIDALKAATFHHLEPRFGVAAALAVGYTYAGVPQRMESSA